MLLTLQKSQGEAEGAERGRPLQCPKLAARMSAAKTPFVSRRVDFSWVTGLSRGCAPHPGDLVLARVDELGMHSKLESPHGRRVQLYQGDEIILAYGARYAPDQFEALMPDDDGPCDLVAAGGIAARVVSRHAGVRKATSVTPLGILLGEGRRPLNLRQFALPEPPANGLVRTVIAVVGTSMNAGKTTVAANLIRGLTAGGVRVGACKVTGTGSGGDLWAMLDAGARHVLDFTDAGWATTAGLAIPLLQRTAHDLISHCEAADVDAIVVEVADGLLQRETSALLSEPAFTARFDAIVLAAADAMGATAGYAWLRERGLPVQAVTGLVTASPLGAMEAAHALDVEVVPTGGLSESATAARICHTASGRAPRSVAN